MKPICLVLLILGATVGSANCVGVKCSSLVHDKLISDIDLNTLSAEDIKHLKECLELMHSLGEVKNDGNEIDVLKRGLFKKIGAWLNKNKGWLVPAVTTAVSIIGKREIGDLDCTAIDYSQLDDNLDSYLKSLTEEKRKEVLGCLELLSEELGVVQGKDSKVEGVEKRGLWSWIKDKAKKVGDWINRNKDWIVPLIKKIKKREPSATQLESLQMADSDEVEALKRGLFKKIGGWLNKNKGWLVPAVKTAVSIIGKREVGDLDCTAIDYSQLDDNLDDYLKSLTEEKRKEVLGCLELLSEELGVVQGKDSKVEGVEKRGLWSWIKDKAKKVGDWINRNKDWIVPLISKREPSAIQVGNLQKVDSSLSALEKRGLWGWIKEKAKKVGDWINRNKDWIVPLISKREASDFDCKSIDYSKLDDDLDGYLESLKESEREEVKKCLDQLAETII